MAPTVEFVYSRPRTEVDLCLPGALAFHSSAVSSTPVQHHAAPPMARPRPHCTDTGPNTTRFADRRSARRIVIADRLTGRPAAGLGARHTAASSSSPDVRTSSNFG